MKRTVVLSVEIAPNVRVFVNDDKITDYVRASVAEALASATKKRLLTGLTVIVHDVFEPPPVCICDGGEQGDGLCAIPHEDHCPLADKR